MSAKYRKLQVVEKNKDFRKATKIVSELIPSVIGADDVLVKNLFAGVNATDINAIENRYGPKLDVPYNIGLEALGQVMKTGSNVVKVTPGDYVVVYFTGGYSEYQVAPAAACMKIPKPDPQYLALNVSGLTAAVSLGEIGKPKEGQIALVTAAAGGTGSLAVQILKKLYKCRVAGTCSTPEKAAHLKSIGCDVVIDYTKSKEEVMRQLAMAAPNGFDIIYESVGGTLRQLALQNIAVHGRIIFIGSISGYKDGSSWLKRSTLEGSEAIIKSGLILRRSASVSGFLLPQFRDVIPFYFDQLMGLFDAGELTLRVDEKGWREGLEKVAEAVEYLHSGKSYGKVLVKIANP